MISKFVFLSGRNNPETLKISLRFDDFYNFSAFNNNNRQRFCESFVSRF